MVEWMIKDDPVMIRMNIFLGELIDATTSLRVEISSKLTGRFF